MLSTIQTIGVLGYAIALFVVGRSINWTALISDKRQQHIVFGATAAVFVLWIFRTGIYEGLNVHFLWLSALTLTLGFRWSVISASLALLGVTLAGMEPWTMLGVNGLLGVFLPIGLTYFIYVIAFHKIPRHLFVYIFVCAFFPGAIAIAAKMLALGGYYTLDGIHSWMVAKDNYMILVPLMLFPEGLLNGMTITLLIIYKPEWVYTFHDKFYIDGK